MANRAEEVAEENSWTFTGEIEANNPAAYTAEFTSDDSDEPFYGWAIVSDEEDVDFVFGSDQMIFSGDYITTEEDYYETIGAGI